MKENITKGLLLSYATLVFLYIVIGCFNLEMSILRTTNAELRSLIMQILGIVIAAHISIIYALRLLRRDIVSKHKDDVLSAVSIIRTVLIYLDYDEQVDNIIMDNNGKYSLATDLENYRLQITNMLINLTNSNLLNKNEVVNVVNAFRRLNAYNYNYRKHMDSHNKLSEKEREYHFLKSRSSAKSLRTKIQKSLAEIINELSKKHEHILSTRYNDIIDINLFYKHEFLLIDGDVVEKLDTIRTINNN